MTAPPRTVAPLTWPSDAVLAMPGSKSEANRLLVAAALSGREVTITGATLSDDVRRLIAGLTTLGFAVTLIDEATGTIRVGPRRGDALATGELDCGNAGTALRFLLSVAAITPGEWVVTGDEHMQRRPIQPLADAWQQLGVKMSTDNGCPPVLVRGSHAAGGKTAIDASQSSQFVSSLLLTGASLRNGIEIEFVGELASRAYAEWTCTTLAQVGADARVQECGARVAPGYRDVPTQVQVGGDWSSMGVWTSLNYLTGSRVHATNLRPNSGQADERLSQALEQLAQSGNRTIDVAPFPDQFLNLAVVAAATAGTTHFVGGANLRIKECDRIAVVARELNKLGADIEQQPEGMLVRGGHQLGSATIDPENDHRVAMAFALLGCVHPGIAIATPDCVGKSYPEFWRDLDRVRSQHRPVAIVGMRATGKTTLGRALAARTGSAFIDTDQAFERDHGPITDYVAANGWPAFRTIEEQIVRDSLRRGHVIATGGGAIESASTRAGLRAHALVVWLSAKPALLQQRLAADANRPSLTGAPVTDEVDRVLARREPLYREVADNQIAAELPLERQIEQALASAGG